MNVSSPIPHKKARIEIIPLIDIMFFLLASFMMVSLSQTTMKGMKVNLPIGSSGQTQSKKDYVSLSVDKDGYYYFDKTRIALEEILPKLKQVYATAPEAKIFIRADRDSLHGNVTRMLDQIRSSGFQKLSFEIKSEASLRQLDTFLRRIWLECCGHMSAFHIGSLRYSSIVDNEFGKTRCDAKSCIGYTFASIRQIKWAFMPAGLRTLQVT